MQLPPANSYSVVFVLYLCFNLCLYQSWLLFCSQSLCRWQRQGSDIVNPRNWQQGQAWWKIFTERWTVKVCRDFVVSKLIITPVVELYSKLHCPAWRFLKTEMIEKNKRDKNETIHCNGTDKKRFPALPGFSKVQKITWQVFEYGNMILLQWQVWDDGEGQLFLLAADIGICCMSRYIYLAVFGAVWIHSEYIWVLQEFLISQYISKQDIVICSCQGTYSAAVNRKLHHWYQGLRTDVVLAENFGNRRKYCVWTSAFLSPVQDLS